LRTWCRSMSPVLSCNGNIGSNKSNGKRSMPTMTRHFQVSTVAELLYTVRVHRTIRALLSIECHFDFSRSLQRQLERQYFDNFYMIGVHILGLNHGIGHPNCFGVRPKYRSTRGQLVLTGSRYKFVLLLYRVSMFLPISIVHQPL
jgi:hypothetical protein